MERLYLTPGEMIAAYSAAGRGKLNRPTASLLLLGILAGAIIAVAGAATNTAAYGIACWYLFHGERAKCYEILKNINDNPSWGGFAEHAGRRDFANWKD